MENKNIIFRQLFEKDTSTYTYILADKNSKEAIIIDPVKTMVERDLKILEELDLKLKYILDTHVHADHVTGSFDLRKKTNAQIVVGKGTGVKCANILLEDGEEISFGDIFLKALATPGHTDGCTSYVIENMVFTGDAMLIRSCGRVDFQQGDSGKLYDSIQKLFSLPDDTIVYPGHDYKGNTSSTILEEKKFNRFASIKDKTEFMNAMDSRELPLPKYIHMAVPSNNICGEKVVGNNN